MRLFISLPLLTPIGLTLAVAQVTTPYGLLETVVTAGVAALGALVLSMGLGLWALVSVGVGYLVQWWLS